MGVVSSRIISDDKSGDLRRITYGITTQDNVEHTAVILSDNFSMDPNTLLPQLEVDTWKDLVEKDIQNALTVVTEYGLQAVNKVGGDPTQVTAAYATASEIYAALFEWWKDAKPLEAAGLVPGIDAISDAQLLALIPGITQTDVDAIRAKTASLRPLSDAIISAGVV